MGRELETRGAELERRLEESERTRQTLAEALSETLRHLETAEREWAGRVAEAEAARARAEQERDALSARLAGAGGSTSAAAGGPPPEAEPPRGAELQRHKDVLVDLERRLEASARAEAQARRRIAELERERASREPPERIAALEQALAQSRDELDDLRTENEFLSREVARYGERNRELLAQLKKP